MRAAITFMTGRSEPHLEWVLNSLEAQVKPSDSITLIVVDVFGRPAEAIGFTHRAWIEDLIETTPKPNPWQGIARVTDRDWWATANARNTAIVMCPEDVDYIAFLDDRCRPGSEWMNTLRSYESGRHAVVCGSYDKIEDDGHGGLVRSVDHRRKIHPNGKTNCGGQWLYGCSFALPLEWALRVNGFEEGCDGLTGEDYTFGLMLANNGYRIDFSTGLYVEQDRTKGNESCKGTYACKDKGVSPNDKSHAALERFGKRTRTEFTPNLVDMRKAFWSGQPWPVPTGEERDWYDGELIRDMKM